MKRGLDSNGLPMPIGYYRGTFRRGIAAHEQGIARTQNPYVKYRYRAAWEQGWDCAAADVKTAPLSLSESRRQAIYDAVHDRLMDLRVEVSRDPTPHTLDDKIAGAMDQAGQAAIEAAETGKHSRPWRVVQQ